MVSHSNIYIRYNTHAPSPLRICRCRVQTPEVPFQKAQSRKVVFPQKVAKKYFKVPEVTENHPAVVRKQNTKKGKCHIPGVL